MFALEQSLGPASPFWSRHNYGSVGFFSYLYDLSAPPRSCVEQAIQRLHAIALRAGSGKSKDLRHTGKRRHNAIAAVAATSSVSEAHWSSSERKEVGSGDAEAGVDSQQQQQHQHNSKKQQEKKEAAEVQDEADAAAAEAAEAEAAAYSADKDISEATVAEWWVHSRPHRWGHQLHFDSDDEGRNGLRHPVLGSVFFVEGDVGGPTLMTNQRLGDQHLADQGCLIYPRTNR
jgi:hypothetical protein